MSSKTVVTKATSATASRGRKSQPVEQYLAVGRRKTSVARVFLRPGSGQFTVKTSKGKTYTLQDFFGTHTHWCHLVTKPLELLEVSNKYDVYTTVSGGGVNGQAEAIRLGLARALDLAEQATLTAQGVDFEAEHDKREWHVALRSAGYLTRDARAVLRKLYGLVKARKAKQFSKR